MSGYRKYPYHPQQKGSDFLGGRGGSICLIFQQGEVHHREIFPEGSRDAQECNKEKTQKFTPVIYLQRYETGRKLKSH